MASAGLPGTGIGGLFYLLAALTSPVRFLVRRAARGRPAGSWRDVIDVAVIAIGVIGGIWFAGWLLGVVLASHPAALSGLSPRAFVASGHAANVLRVAAVIAGLATLALVLGGVELALLVSRLRRRLPALAPGDRAL
jgi:hypothetical protein